MWLGRINHWRSWRVFFYFSSIAAKINSTLKHSQSHLWSNNYELCMLPNMHDSQKRSKRIDLRGLAAESGRQLDALSHVRDFICGDWRTEDAVGQPSCWWGHEFTATLTIVCLGAGWNTLMHTTHTLLHNPPLKHFVSLLHWHTHPPTLIHQVQKSTQYLGGYSREGGALRDDFGYLQSFYPQGSEHQLLLGRTQKGFLRGLWKEVRPEDERAEGKHTDTWAEAMHTWRSVNHAKRRKGQFRC